MNLFMLKWAVRILLFNFVTESLQYKARILDQYYHDHDGLLACNKTIDIYDIEYDTWLPMCTNKGKLLQQHLNWIRLNYTTFKDHDGTSTMVEISCERTSCSLAGKNDSECVVATGNCSQLTTNPLTSITPTIGEYTVTPKTMLPTVQPTYISSVTTTSGLGGFIAVQFVIMAGTTIGWICTCVHMRRKKKEKYAISNNTQFTNATYVAHHHTELQQATDISTNSIHNISDTNSNHSDDDNHTYAVIPANCSRAVKKRPVSLMHTPRGTMPGEFTPKLPPIPRRVSVADLGIPQTLNLAVRDARSRRPSALMTTIENSSNGPEENTYYLCDQDLRSSDNVENSDCEHIYYVLEETDIGNSSEQISGHHSEFEPKASIAGVTSQQLSTVSDDNEKKMTPTDYEVPVSLLTTQDEVRLM